MTRDTDLETLIDAIAVLAKELRGPGASPFGPDLTRSQMDVLFTLSRVVDTTVRDLARTLAVTSAAVSQILVPLEKAELIVREPDPADGRSRRLRLTDAARARVDEFQQARIHALTPRFDSVADTDIAATARILGALVDDGGHRG